MSTARTHSRVWIRARAFFVDLPFHASCICHALSLLLVHVHPMLHSLPVVSTVSNSLTPCPSPMRKLHIIDECVLVHHMERCQSVSSMLHTTWRFFLRHRWDIGTRHPPDLTYWGPGALRRHHTTACISFLLQRPATSFSRHASSRVCAPCIMHRIS
jgi:hypothetical protein